MALFGLVSPWWCQFVIIRWFVAAFGCTAIVWGAVALPIFWRQAPLNAIATRIIDGEAFQAQSLDLLLPEVQGVTRGAFCRPAASRNAAVILVRAAEDQLSADARDTVDVRLDAARNAIRYALSCSPADPFLWLALYWVENTQHGFRAEHLKYLRLSYQLGPNEGWIALKRSRAAFAVFQKLPADLAEHTIREFVALLESALYGPAVDIFIGPAWPQRELILSRLTHLREQDRQLLANELVRRGYDVNVPGIFHRTFRSWH